MSKNYIFCVPKNFQEKVPSNLGKLFFVSLLKITENFPSSFLNLFCMSPKNLGCQMSKNCVFCVYEKSRKKSVKFLKTVFCVLKKLRGKSSVKFGKTVFC